MLFERSGDMFQQAPFGALIGIPVNTIGVAGKGLALHMKKRYPEAHKVYLRACRDGPILDGELVVVDMVHFKLAMMPTKYNWTEPSSPDLIDETMNRLYEYMLAHEIEECHIPRLGCGIATGMLDYESEVKPILVHYFAEDEEQTQALYVYDGL